MKIEVKNTVNPIDYDKSIEILEERVNDVLIGNKDELLWLIEHNPVYTAGTSAKDSDIIDKSTKIIKTKRGGKHTYHGPGQKIAYFVLNLNRREKDIKKLINQIESCIIEILNEYNINSYADSKNIGIWVDKENKSKKIAAIGIRVRKWVAYHGFSLNVENDLSKYKKIVPCGINDKGITSLKDLGVKNYNNIEKVIIEKFLSSFS